MRKMGALGAALLLVAATTLVGAGNPAFAAPHRGGGAGPQGGAAGSIRSGIGTRSAAASRMGGFAGQKSSLRGGHFNRVALHSSSHSTFHHSSSRSTVHHNLIPHALARSARGPAVAGSAPARKGAALTKTVHGRTAAKPRAGGVAPSRSQTALGGPMSGPAYVRPRYHGGFIGWSGGLFWPYAYDDIFDYTLWPYDYDQTFWAYAYADVYNSIIWPYGYDDPVSIGMPGGRLTHSRNGARREQEVVCGGRTPGLTDWPIERIERTVQPTHAQQATLDQLKGASGRAMKELQAECPTDTVSTPLARLDAMERRLEAMLRAVGIVRPALAKFYNSLGDEQKARFDAIVYASGGGRRQANPSHDSGPQRPTQFCRGDRGPVLSEQSIRRIEQAVHPTESQRGALDDLQHASSKAIGTLQSACPRGIPTTPLARLEVLAKRLGAMAEAVKTMRPAMEHLYSLLGDMQRARFDAIGSREGPATTVGEKR
jgi:LTXXQ motif family protein